MTTKTLDPTRPVLGYALKKRIGAGGYGEVWEAEAPGGLPKAIKIIFGYHDQKRAQTELKSLNRIRDVRHPFLLSLERIDVVDGQMIVISELADMCLKTRFQQCCDSGLKGVPREELLSYLRDAANALDFISEEFHLQHLDIKPENLLLVSGHVKVADFGLVKDIHDGTQSLMAGLTPAYAPPELFDGRPSLASDQYSLAILYQEMLTGVRPFDGVTAAQLAGQHLRERPNLRPLPRADQAVISRSLSKAPECRYPSCTAMLTDLTAEKSNSSGASPRMRKNLREFPSPRRSRRKLEDSSAMLTALTRPFATSAADEKKLPPIPVNPIEATIRPTLFLGLGHTGTKILRGVRRRFSQRFGTPDCLPALKFLTVDTDTQNLWQSCPRGRDDALLPEELFETPLKKPEDYRADARMHLTWLSRRWIYNIPKSLQTEGIRPLGRLALATHIEPFAIRLRQVLSELIDPDALSKTASTLGLEELPHPRVILVGSTNGGTCSGMALDVAYLVRFILQQLATEQQDVIGFFAHSTNALHLQRELATANTLAFLNELYHFSCVEEYPGDASCGIPAATAGTTTFASTYLVHLGDNLEAEQFQQGLDSLSEYLCLSTATPCASFFDASRLTESETEGLPLRTMGLSRSGSNLNQIINLAACELRRSIVDQWTDPRFGDFEPGPSADQIIKKHGLETSSLAKLVQESLNRAFDSPLILLSRAFAEAIDPDDKLVSIDRVISISESYLGPGESDNKLPIMVAAVQAATKSWVDETTSQIHDDLTHLIDAPGRRIAGTMLVAESLSNKLAQQIKCLRSYEESSDSKIQRHLQDAYEGELLTERSREDFAKRLAAEHLKRFGLVCVRKLVAQIIPTCLTVKQSTEAFRSDIVIDRTPKPLDPQDEDARPDKFNGLILQKLRAQIPQMLPRAEQLIQLNYLDEFEGLRSIINDGYQREFFLAELQKAARMTVMERMKGISLVGMFGEQDLAERISAYMYENARPELLQCGGGSRWMHAFPINDIPADSLVDSFRKLYQGDPTLIPATIGEVVSCIEVENVPLENVTMHLLQHRTDSLEYASRLHTRTDISWTSISSMR